MRNKSARDGSRRNDDSLVPRIMRDASDARGSRLIIAIFLAGDLFIRIRFWLWPVKP